MLRAIGLSPAAVDDTVDFIVDRWSGEEKIEQDAPRCCRIIVEGKLWDRQGDYIGEIIHRVRLLRDQSIVYRLQHVHMFLYSPDLPTPPLNREAYLVPPGFFDLQFDDEGYVLL